MDSGENDLTWDAGFNLGLSEESGEARLPAMVGIYVWNDANADGIQNADEEALVGVVVELYNEDGLLIATTVTDENGNYLFPNLVPGPYYIEFVPPTDYVISPTNRGERSSDSDVNPETGRTQVFILQAGLPNLELDAGLHAVRPTNLDETAEPTSLDEVAEPGSLSPRIFIPYLGQ